MTKLDELKEAQALRLEIASQQEQIEHLKQEIERLRYRQERMVEEGASSQVEALLAELAGPVSQLRAQSVLNEQGKQLQARDVLAVAGRIVRALERQGLIFEGAPGEHSSYDPDRHTPLSAGAALQPGQAAIVRFSGISYHGKILYKAVVEACQDD
jgi:molecular chaperone GrpE (heat shock protein)